MDALKSYSGEESASEVDPKEEEKSDQSDEDKQVGLLGVQITSDTVKVKGHQNIYWTFSGSRR